MSLYCTYRGHIAISKNKRKTFVEGLKESISLQDLIHLMANIAYDHGPCMINIEHKKRTNLHFVFRINT